MKPNPVDQIDLAFLRKAFPSNTTAGLVPWIEPLKAACQEFGIDTVREVASFFANIAVESRDLRSLSESLNYSVQGLLSTFGRHRISREDANRLGRKAGEGPLSQDRQRQIANLLYGGEWGRENLGNIRPDDGWTMRGFGPKQITGRDNYTRLAAALGKSLTDTLAYVRTKEGGCRAAGWFWKSHNLDAKAATPGVRDDRIAINGGTNGLDTVEDRFDVLVQDLLHRGC